MRSNFELNPLDDIEKVKDEDIREICIMSITEAKKCMNPENSKEIEIAYDNIRINVSNKLNRLVREGKI